MITFLNEEKVGRVASIDVQGYPQIIPMNFVYVKNDSIDTQTGNNNIGAIYMHSHPFGEKLKISKEIQRLALRLIPMYVSCHHIIFILPMHHRQILVY